MPFPSLAFVFRAIKGSDLTPAEADGNVSITKTALEYLRDNPPAAVSIDSITQSGNALTVHLSDSSTQGPFTLPSIPLTFRGAWAASTAYAVGDVITSGGSTYMVIYAHTSGSGSFDAGANDGMGHSYYGLLLSNPSGALPAGGAAGQYLIKTGSGDYAVAWGDITSIRTIKTISGTTATLAAADSGKWHRFTSATAVTITVPLDADVSIPVGSYYIIRQVGAGALTLSPTSGVTVNPLSGYDLATDTQGATLELTKVGTDEWDLVGFEAAV